MKHCTKTCPLQPAFSQLLLPPRINAARSLSLTILLRTCSERIIKRRDFEAEHGTHWATPMQRKLAAELVLTGMEPVDCDEQTSDEMTAHLSDYLTQHPAQDKPMTEDQVRWTCCCPNSCRRAALDLLLLEARSYKLKHTSVLRGNFAGGALHLHSSFRASAVLSVHADGHTSQ